MRFRQTLTTSERHFVARLESFGDIVVGFSMSLLALQLDIPKTPSEVFAHTLRYALFFGAFGVVSLFWFRFHRIMSTGFAPHRPDVILLFAFLAFVALTPYAMLTFSRLNGGVHFSPEGLELYLGVFLGVLTFSWLLSLRGMRRAWAVLDARERKDAWSAFVGGLVAIPGFGAALYFVTHNGERAFSVTVVLLVGIPLATRALRAPWPVVIGPAYGTPPAAGDAAPAVPGGTRAAANES